MKNRNYRIDNSFVEHSCCWFSAIVADCEQGKGQYGGDVELICECDSENAELIVNALTSYAKDK